MNGTPSICNCSVNRIGNRLVSAEGITTSLRIGALTFALIRFRNAYGKLENR